MPALPRRRLTAGSQPNRDRHDASRRTRRRSAGPPQGGFALPARARQLCLGHGAARPERGRLPAQPDRSRPHPAHCEAAGQRRARVHPVGPPRGGRHDRADHGARLQALRMASAGARQGALRRRGGRHVRRADARRGRGPDGGDRASSSTSFPCWSTRSPRATRKTSACTSNGTTIRSSRSISTTATTPTPRARRSWSGASCR